MSKAKVDWAFQELITSAKLDEMVLDDIRNWHLGFHTNGAAGTSASVSHLYVGWVYYNPAKSVYDRIRLYLAVVVGAGGGAVEYSLDSGATWVSAGAGTALPAAVVVTIGDSGASNNALPSFYDIDLSGILASNYVGLRVVNGTVTTAQWSAQGILYRLSDTPF